MECIGEVVRRPVARAREAAAAARGVSDVASYMFALDADHVVDASKSGNLARFVNHSCRFPSSARTPLSHNCKQIFAGLQMLWKMCKWCKQSIYVPLQSCRFTSQLLMLVWRGRPNCVATVLEVKGTRRIFLIAGRQLAPGEELTYAASFQGISKSMYEHLCTLTLSMPLALVEL